jgi:hypothetical protein
MLQIYNIISEYPYITKYSFLLMAFPEKKCLGEFVQKRKEFVFSFVA